MKGRRLIAIVISVLVAVLLPATAAAATATAAARPTIVLVHGAWDNATSWDAVASRLRTRGYAVTTPDDPLRSLRGDAAAITSFLREIQGPIVLVGHSYGGAVITNAAVGNPNIRALVYIAAFAPEAGETVLGLLLATRPGSLVPAALIPTPFIAPGGGIGIDTRISPLLFHTVFAQDVSRQRAAQMAASQHPAALPTGTQHSGQPAWRQIPSWFLVARQDRVIPPAVERLMAARARSHTIEIDSSHAAHVSNPQAVADLVLAAAAATGASRTPAAR